MTLEERANFLMRAIYSIDFNPTMESSYLEHLKAVCNEALEEAAMLAEKWGDASFARLHGGEFSASEIRAIKAVVCNVADSIRALKGNK